MPLNNTLLLALAPSGFLLLWVVFLTVQIRRLEGKHKAIKALSRNEDITEAIDELYRMCSSATARVDETREAQLALAKGLIGAVQGVGVVRFDAFDDVGGRLSFSVALLDAEGSGVVLSSINGRQEGRCYAKAVDRGSSNFDLSEEERQAIKRAMK